MALCYQDAKMLWEARRRGESFKDTLTVGHLTLYLHPSELRLLKHAHNAQFPEPTLMPLGVYKFGDYSDEFLREFLGVTSLTTMDYSAYEGASTIHDLNQPVPETLWGRFDAVIEAGSLEHIFNFPVAIGNLMRMLKVGGNIFIATPSNNMCGHGFYQFSPELFFRVLSSENGFKVRSIVLLESAFPSPELSCNRKLYLVTDPAFVRNRVGLRSNKPVTMMVEATKVADLPLFSRMPLQSDYVTVWNQEDLDTGIATLVRKIFAKLPFTLQTRLKGYREMRRFSLSNTRCYKRL